MRARPTTPPTTPPAMAPTLVLELELDEEFEFESEFGGADVFDGEVEPEVSVVSALALGEASEEKERVTGRLDEASDEVAVYAVYVL